MRRVFQLTVLRTPVVHRAFWSALLRDWNQRLSITLRNRDRYGRAGTPAFGVAGRSLNGLGLVP